MSFRRFVLLEPGPIDPGLDAGARADCDLLSTARRAGLITDCIDLSRCSDRLSLIRSLDDPDVLLAASRPGAGSVLAAMRPSRARTLFFGHDIHHWRFHRWRLCGAEQAPRLDQIRLVQRLEQRCWNLHDLSLYPSEVEAAWVRRQGAAAMVWPYFAFQFPPSQPSIRSRDGKRNQKQGIFIGGSRHIPNRDGVLHFLKTIWPLWRHRDPALSLTVIGDWSSVEARHNVGPGVTWTGAISEADVERLMSAAGWSVVPLRFGAGVKRKLLQALYQGLPVLTTPVGAEGLPRPLPTAIGVCSLSDWGVLDVSDWAESVANVEGFTSGHCWLEQHYSETMMNRSFRVIQKKFEAR